MHSGQIRVNPIICLSLMRTVKDFSFGHIYLLTKSGMATDFSDATS